ncbi:hypothetical protein [Amycolatopsis vastitatis]|uniref:hypothetical protein n=1 Tax=Amycolatopsis vastitatis TaxID=1905142 RepID=UPI0011784316|nr:hypothetical protein [Amycolatopsis vastitatis]
MSFDLVVWPASAVTTVEDADRKYEQLVTCEPESAAVDPRAVAFHRELTARYPPRSSLPMGQRADSPWCCDPAVVGEGVLMTIVWSAADTVSRFVRELAARHDLVCYDPEAGEVHSPPSVRRGSMSVLAGGAGSRGNTAKDTRSASPRRGRGAGSDRPGLRLVRRGL